MNRIAEKDQFGLNVEYEYIAIKIDDSNTGQFVFFQNGKKEIINIVGRGEVLIKRRKWS